VQDTPALNERVVEQTDPRESDHPNVKDVFQALKKAKIVDQCTFSVIEQLRNIHKKGGMDTDTPTQRSTHEAETPEQKVLRIFVTVLICQRSGFTSVILMKTDDERIELKKKLQSLGERVQQVGYKFQCRKMIQEKKQIPHLQDTSTNTLPIINVAIPIRHIAEDEKTNVGRANKCLQNPIIIASKYNNKKGLLGPYAGSRNQDISQIGLTKYHLEGWKCLMLELTGTEVRNSMRFRWVAINDDSDDVQKRKPTKKQLETKKKLKAKQQQAINATLFKPTEFSKSASKGTAHLGADCTLQSIQYYTQPRLIETYSTTKTGK